MTVTENADYQRIEKVIRHLERRFREQPSLLELARIAGLSESHFHRLFSRWAGTTPKAFLKYLTAEHAKGLLRESRDLLSVSLEAGLSGPGRLHDLLVTVEGMSPGEFKAQGAGVEIRYGFQDSPFGRCLLGVTARGICHLAFMDPGRESAALRELRERWPRAELGEDVTRVTETAAQVFQLGQLGKRRPISIHVPGSPFQLKVWEALLRIPPGRVLSYGDLAKELGNPGAARAVGSAVGANAVGFLIPCHRVIRESGIIGDYRWGSARKKAMLAWESASVGRDLELDRF